MLDDIHSSNGSLIVAGASNSGPYVNCGPDDPRAVPGDVRYSNHMFQVFASGCWTTLFSNVADVSLRDDDINALRWAKDKMLEEETEKKLMNKYPALKKAKENYNTIRALVENDN